MGDHPFTTITCICCGHVITVPVYCKNRFCPVCAGPRHRRLRKQLQWYCSNVRLLPGQRLKHVVLTIKSGPDLDECVNKLVHSFRKLRQRKWWKKHVSGGAYVIEITKSESGWHPHIHAVIQSWYMPYDALKANWLKVSGAWGISISERPAYVLANYLTDYITKLPKDIQDSKPLNDALRNRRLFSVFGLWHSMKCPKFKVTFPCPKCLSSAWIPTEILDRQFSRDGPSMKFDDLPRKRALP